jgi:signal transduction histidine kinase
VSLAEFIRSHIESIAEEWEKYARQLSPAGSRLSEQELRDHVPDLLLAIATDIERNPSPEQQWHRAHGTGEDDAPEITQYSRDHAQTRLQQGFELRAMGAEYRALRETVLRLWNAECRSAQQEAEQHRRFGQAIDQAWIEAMAWFGRQLDEARDFMLSVLGHDLRNPLGAVQMSARVLLLDAGLSPESSKAAMRVFNSSARMRDLVDQLLDFTRIRLGHRMQVNFAHSDLELILRETVDELASYHAGVDIQLECSGDLAGKWDSARIAQMLSNLIGNAIEHGTAGSPVAIAARGDAERVTIRIHNDGPPIPSERLEGLFEPRASMLARQTRDRAGSAGFGLGLLIAHEVVVAHGGQVDVASSRHAGTTFTVELPKDSSDA